MSLTFRNVGVYNSNGSTSAVVLAPAGLTNGDLIIVSIRRAAAVNPSVVPAGWTLIKSNLATYGFWVYYKVASNEGASWTWTWAASAKTLGHSYAFYGNYDSANPIQSSTTPYSGTASGTAITIPTLTTSANGTVSIIIASSYSTSAKTHTVPTSPAYIEHSDTGNTSPDFWQAIASYEYPTGGTATGSTSYAASAASTYRVGLRILINPNNPPTVALNSPSNGTTIMDYTPTLNFTGTDPENNNIEYNLEIDASNTFDSNYGNPLRSRYSTHDIQYRGRGDYNSSGSASVIVAAPTGLSEEDLIFVLIRRAAAVDPTSVPEGWTLLQSSLATYGFWLYYKVAENEGASWTWTWAASAKTIATSYAFYGRFDLTNPIQNSTAPYVAAASGTVISIPALTTALDNTPSLLFASSYSTAAKTHTVPTSPAYAEYSDAGDLNSDFYNATAGYVYPTSGTNTGILSYPVSVASTYRVGCQVLINPSISGGFSGNNPYASGAAVSYVTISDLKNGTYYWRVRGSDPDGTGVYGEWSEIRSFTVIGGFKVWNGSDWSYKPLKIWNGTKWITKPLKVWNGSQWVQKG